MISPSRFQWKTWWLALTVLAIAIILNGIYYAGSYILAAIGFLQPVVLPLAIAGILSYLLDPVVTWLANHRWKRLWAVIAVFLTAIAVLAGMIVWVVPTIHRQGESFQKNLPTYSKRAQELLKSTVDNAKHLAERFSPPTASAEAVDPFSAAIQQAITESTDTIQKKAGELLGNAGGFLWKSIGSTLGVLGAMLSLVLVPIFLFFFLNDGPQIGANWANYLPLRASPLKSELVSLISEINGYLISFFRGQLLVSLCDGILIGIGLLVVGLDFALLIGLLVGILGLIPYLGMLICWIPAVIIATAQFGDWTHPLIVTAIFVFMNQVDGLFIAPKIVGESVGLHPLTVIISVLAWSLVLGGLLGALLAVPLTATLKVLLKRYFWDRDPDLPARGPHLPPST